MLDQIQNQGLRLAESRTVFTSVGATYKKLVFSHEFVELGKRASPHVLPLVLRLKGLPGSDEVFGFQMRS